MAKLERWHLLQKVLAVSTSTKRGQMTSGPCGLAASRCPGRSRAAHNRFLIKSLQDLHDSVVLLGKTTFAAPGRIEEALAEHQAIVSAIARRDEVGAEEFARSHVRRGYELRLSAVADTARAGRQARPT